MKILKIPPQIGWPAVIIGALAIHVVASLVTVWIATSNPSYAVEEDYYQKAIRWDEKRAQDARNGELAWRLDVDVLPPSVQGDAAVVDLALTGGAGSPLAGAAVAVEAFHNARAHDILRGSTVTDGDGRGSMDLAMERNGVWELRFTVDHGGDHFTHTETRYLVLNRGQDE